jgi:hypothetical protein
VGIGAGRSLTECPVTFAPGIFFQLFNPILRVAKDGTPGQETGLSGGGLEVGAAASVDPDAVLVPAPGLALSAGRSAALISEDDVAGETTAG